jgi:two-component system, OmpR family, sensor kinase
MIDTLRALPNRVPLRVTLVSSMLLVVTVALGASGAAGTYMVRRYLVDRVDLQLEQLTDALLDQTTGYGPEGEQAFKDRVRALVGWPVLAVAVADPQGGGIIQFFSQPDTDRTAPKLGKMDLESARERAGEPFTTRPASGRGGHDWRVLITVLPDDSGALAVAIRLDYVDDTVGKLAYAQLVIGTIVLAVLAFVGYGMVRASLRGLVTAERTAREIAAGDLSRRVPAAHPDTEVGRLAAAFNTMISEIERAFRARERSAAEARASEARTRRFAADASHELRTPLTAIRGFAELYRQGGGDAGHVIARIEHHATRMSALVEDLLLLARLDQQRPIEQRPVDLLALAADAVQDSTVTGGDHPVRLVASGDRPPVVIGDELQLRQVIGNLLTNAVQHTPAGTDVTVRVDVDTDIVLSVADTGPGLAPEDATRVFERFYRPDPARSRTESAGAQSGSGLGLSIVHAIVTAHGGTIRLETAPGEGARFEVRLPLHAPEALGQAEILDEPEPRAFEQPAAISTQPEAT